MNPAEIHLAINHFPVFATLFGSLILFAALILKKDILRQTAYIFLIMGLIGSILSVYTGEEAEELVEQYFPEISHEIIHEHEEIAESARNLSVVTGILSIIALYLSRTKRAMERILSWLILLCGILGTVLLMRAAHSGGEIKHIEIRPNFEYSE